MGHELVLGVSCAVCSQVFETVLASLLFGESCGMRPCGRGVKSRACGSGVLEGFHGSVGNAW